MIDVMKKYKCEICGREIEVEDYDKLEKCPICSADKQFLKEIEEETTTEETTEEEDTFDTPIPISDENPAIARINEKCINCGRCSFVCKKMVGINYNKKKSKEPVCVNCGQCIINCPVGAIVPKYCYKKVKDYINDTDKIVVAFTSPAVRVALGESFNIEAVNVEGKMVKALKELGFDYVFDTTFGADLTIMEEASELIERIKNKTNLPQFTSCCPAWVKYMEIYHPNLLNHLSTCKSPIGMQGAIIKTYFSEMMNIPKEDIISVAITPCTAKKYEITRNDINDVDYVITSTELALMIRENNINFNELEDEEFDHLMNRGSGAGVIFGASGGVMEAAMRTAYHLVTGENPNNDFLKLESVRGYDSLKEATIKINDNDIKVLVAHGLTNIERILKELEQGICKYDFIEVMNCPGGCVGGGGQPLGSISKVKDQIKKRMDGLYQEDKDIKIHSSYENSDIIDIYKSYLGHPLSKKSEELLHTKYSDKSSILKEQSF